MIKKIFLFSVLGINLMIGFGFAQMNMQQTRNAGTETGTKMMEQTQNRIHIGEMNVETNMEFTQERVQNKEQTKVQLSNGTMSEIKIMPETASENARTRLQSQLCTEDEGCQIQLKEVGSGNKTQAAYQVETKKEVKLFGLFKIQIKINSKINTESGETIEDKYPRWKFLTTESTEK